MAGTYFEAPKDLPMHFMLGLLFSTIGAGYFLYARKERSSFHLLVGVFLIAYPYFVSSLALMILLGVAASVLPLVLSRG